jgi:hypothetical protein
VAIDTKHVKTEVLVENGGTVVIGGIYTQETRNNTQRIPFFGDLPYVGFLFKNRSHRRQDRTAGLRHAADRRREPRGTLISAPGATRSRRRAGFLLAGSLRCDRMSAVKIEDDKPATSTWSA